MLICIVRSSEYFLSPFRNCNRFFSDLYKYKMNNIHVSYKFIYNGSNYNDVISVILPMLAFPVKSLQWSTIIILKSELDILLLFSSHKLGLLLLLSNYISIPLFWQAFDCEIVTKMEGVYTCSRFSGKNMSPETFDPFMLSWSMFSKGNVCFW